MLTIALRILLSIHFFNSSTNIVMNMKSLQDIVLERKLGGKNSLQGPLLVKMTVC